MAESEAEIVMVAIGMLKDQSKEGSECAEELLRTFRDLLVCAVEKV